MNERRPWSRILCVAGVIVSVLSIPGFFFAGGFLSGICRYLLCLLFGSGLMMGGAFLSKSRNHTLVSGTLGLALVGVSVQIACWFLLLAGNVYSPSWGLYGPLVLVSGLGVCASLTGATLALLESPYASLSGPGYVEMSRRRWWSRTVSFVGIAMIAVGVVAVVRARPGTLSAVAYLLIIPGSGLVALGAFLGKSRYRKFLVGALGLALYGLVSPFVIWAFHFDTPDPWMAFVEHVLYVYPIAGVMSALGAMLVIIQSSRGSPASGDTAEKA
jgi:hypothetical protein